MADTALPQTSEDDDHAAAWWVPILMAAGFVLVGWWVYDKVSNPGLMTTGGVYADGAAASHGDDHHGTDHGAEKTADHSQMAEASATAAAGVVVGTGEGEGAGHSGDTMGALVDANEAGAAEAHTDDMTETAALETPAAVADFVNEVAAGGEVELTVGDVVLNGASGGVEQQLLGFIESGRAPCTESDCWFTFDRLTFSTGSAILDLDRSAAQLSNIDAILTAYPTLELKFGGYTDNRGDERFNEYLSGQRAQAVVDALIARGFDASRFGAEGYGSQFPIATNDTASGRAQNRRVDVRVRAR